MNTRSFCATALVCATALTVSAVLSSAGPLSPPAGPVASTNKTLQEVEPRIAVNATNTPGDADSIFKITEPGSYYLSENVGGAVGKHSIEIASSHVTLDLMGYRVGDFMPAQVTLDGITATGALKSVVIRNGTVSDFDGDGIDVLNVTGAVVEDVIVTDCGMNGIFTGSAAIVSGCAADNNGNNGIHTGGGSAVTGCTAYANNGNGIFAAVGSTITNNLVRSNVSIGIFAFDGSTISGNTATENEGVGIVTGSASTAEGNTVWNNGADGIVAANGTTITGNTVRFNTLNGIQVLNDCLVLNNLCHVNGNGGDGAGIHVVSDDNRIEGNIVTDNDRGIDVDSAGNLIIRNSWSGNTANAPIVAGNSVGPTVNSASIATSSNPHANYSF